MTVIMDMAIQNEINVNKGHKNKEEQYSFFFINTFLKF